MPLQKSPAPFQPSAAFSSPQPTETAAATRSPAPPAVSSIFPSANGKLFHSIPPEYFPQCKCSRCTRRGETVKPNIHNAETKSEYKYLELERRADGRRVLFVHTFPYTIAHPDTKEEKHYPEKFIQVAEELADWIKDPPNKNSGLHLAWTLGGLCRNSHFAETMLASEESEDWANFFLDNGLHIMHLPELRYLFDGGKYVDSSAYRLISGIICLHGVPLFNTYATKYSGPFAQGRDGAYVEPTIRFLMEAIKNYLRHCRSELSPDDQLKLDSAFKNAVYLFMETYAGPWKWDKFCIVELNKRYPGLIDAHRHFHQACFKKLRDLGVQMEMKVHTFGQKNRASFAAMGLVEAFLELGLNIQGIDATYDDVDADLIRRFVESKTIAPHPSTFLYGNSAEQLVESFINDVSTLLRPIVASTDIDINLSRRIIRLSKRKSPHHIRDPLPDDGAPSATDSTEATDEFFDEDSAVDDGVVERCIVYWVVNNKKWDDQFSQLVLFESQHKHCDVPRSFPENQKLSNWVSYQRKEYRKKKNGEPSQITDDRVRRLEEIGFRWEVQASAWDDMFSQLVLFESQHKHCDVPRSFPEKKLANWVMNQRRFYKKKKNGEPSQITDDRVRQLEEIGFRWSIK